MDTDAAARVIALFEGRGQLDKLDHVGAKAARACLDRAKERKSAAAILTEAQLWESAFTAAYDAYRTAANKALIHEAITGDNNDRPTIAIAEKIARAMKVKGFSIGGAGTGGGGSGPKPPEPTPPEDLYDDPTHFEGPESLEGHIGKVKSVYFKLNAKDGFLGAGRRAQLDITCDHPDIGPEEITVGELRSGRVRRVDRSPRERRTRHVHDQCGDPSMGQDVRRARRAL